MFCGFQCQNLSLVQFENWNGLRLTMRKPVYPCKVGLILRTGLNEYDHYAGHILDVDTRPRQDIPAEEPYMEYEIPIELMTHDSISNSLVKNATENVFECRGLTFSLETSQQPGKDEVKVERKKLKDIDIESRLQSAIERKPISIQIKKIDVIYNPEYELLS